MTEETAVEELADETVNEMVDEAADETLDEGVNEVGWLVGGMIELGSGDG